MVPDSSLNVWFYFYDEYLKSIKSFWDEILQYLKWKISKIKSYNRILKFYNALDKWNQFGLIQFYKYIANSITCKQIFITYFKKSTRRNEYIVI